MGPMMKMDAVSIAIRQLNEIKRGMQQDVHPGRGSFLAYFWTVVSTAFENHHCVIIVLPFYSVCYSLYQSNDINDVGGIFDTMLSQDYQLLDEDQNYDVIMEVKSLNLTIV
ncbi:hypothetical protein CHARACLAT_033304 [Characodon lateralis]|uniref:Uncharacterized protein n=1 Tax=Characodon lateralis TaxID=208331 RepID=A0ABU7EYU9_9TELE|nr:hypothetical protein [Characodon lateralis]